MKIINCGSLNIDHVYRVPRFVAPGETLATRDYQVFAGGKGNNQSVALARARAPAVLHAGKIGTDGRWLCERLAAEGVDTRLITTSQRPTGHAIVQVSDEGENAILLCGGANQDWNDVDVARVVEVVQPDDVVLLQNEINATCQLLEGVAERGAQIVLNPAPMTEAVRQYPLSQVGLFIVNETEAWVLTGESQPRAVAAAMRARFPDAAVVLTLGPSGALYAGADGEHRRSASPVTAVDTTAAGDTFIGYFVAHRAAGASVPASLDAACRAAALCVTRRGAVDAIPQAHEIADPTRGPTE